MKTAYRTVFLLLPVFAAAAVWIIRGGFLRHPPGGQILCLGDSLTENPDGGYIHYLSHLLKKRGYRLSVISAGRPGHTSGEYYRYLRQSSILTRTRPDFILLMLGTNDVRIDQDHTPLPRYRAQMTQIIRLILENTRHPGRDPRLILMTVPPIFQPDLPSFDHRSIRRIKEEILPTIRKLGQIHGLMVIDIHRFFQDHPGLLPGIHPRPEGYRQMAAWIIRSLRPFIRQYRANSREQRP